VWTDAGAVIHAGGSTQSPRRSRVEHGFSGEIDALMYALGKGREERQTAVVNAATARLFRISSVTMLGAWTVPRTHPPATPEGASVRLWTLEELGDGPASWGE